MPSALPSVRSKLPEGPKAQSPMRSSLEIKGVGSDTVNSQPVPSAARRPSHEKCLNGCRCGKCNGEKRSPIRPPRKLDPVVKLNACKVEAGSQGHVADATTGAEGTTSTASPALPKAASAEANKQDSDFFPPRPGLALIDPITESHVPTNAILQALRSWPFPTPSPTTDSEPHPIIPILLTHLLAALDYASLTSKTPIILDKSGKVDVFFAHRHSVIVECKPLVLDVFMRHTLSATDGARVIADKIRGAMQVEAFLHFRLTDSAPNFKKLADATLNESTGEIMHHASWFPFADMFDVKAIREDALVAKLDPLNHPGVVRKPNDVPLVVKEGFSVVVTSKFDPEDAVEFLTASLPLSKCQFFHIADPNA